MVGLIKNVTIIILSKDKKVQMLLVKDNNGKWTTPGGKIDDGETPYNAIMRELMEETLYLPFDGIKPKFKKIEHYDYHDTRFYVAHLSKIPRNISKKEMKREMKKYTDHVYHETVEIKNFKTYNFYKILKKLRQCFKTALVNNNKLRKFIDKQVKYLIQ